MNIWYVDSALRVSQTQTEHFEIKKQNILVEKQKYSKSIEFRYFSCKVPCEL